MQLSLGDGERFERGQRTRPNSFGKSRLLDHRRDVPVGANDRSLLCLHLDPRTGKSATEHRCRFERPPADGDALAQRAHFVEIGAEVDERAERHVSGDAGEAVEPGDNRHFNNRITALAAPKPLSMPTTVMPAAHDASMASRAVTPSSAAP